MRASAKLAPKDVLNSVGPLQQTCLSLATAGNNAAATAAPGGTPLVSHKGLGTAAEVRVPACS
jgi:hypothetical protein